MIELLLQAERALGLGEVDGAERLYRQAAEADPRNSIAVVGLARVALERGDETKAWHQARRALDIDPENVAAQRLVVRLEEVWADRGVPPPSSEPGPETGPGSGPASEARPLPDAVPTPPPPRERTALDRLLRRNRP